LYETFRNPKQDQDELERLNIDNEEMNNVSNEGRREEVDKVEDRL
jgi:hypothetical protein